MSSPEDSKKAGSFPPTAWLRSTEKQKKQTAADADHSTAPTFESTPTNGCVFVIVDGSPVNFHRGTPV